MKKMKSEELQLVAEEKEENRLGNQARS